MWVADTDRDLVNLRNARQIFVQERRIKMVTFLNRWCVVAVFGEVDVVVRHFGSQETAQEYLERLAADLGVME